MINTCELKVFAPHLAVRLGCVSLCSRGDRWYGGRAASARGDGQRARGDRQRARAGTDGERAGTGSECAGSGSECAGTDSERARGRAASARGDGRRARPAHLPAHQCRPPSVNPPSRKSTFNPIIGTQGALAATLDTC